MGEQTSLFEEENEDIQKMSLSEFTTLIKVKYDKYKYIVPFLEERGYSIFKTIHVDSPEYLRLDTLEMVGEFLTSDCRQGNSYHIYINMVHFVIHII